MKDLFFPLNDFERAKYDHTFHHIDIFISHASFRIKLDVCVFLLLKICFFVSVCLPVCICLSLFSRLVITSVSAKHQHSIVNCPKMSRAGKKTHPHLDNELYHKELSKKLSDNRSCGSYHFIHTTNQH